MNFKKILILLSAMLALSSGAWAQKAGLKTNLVGDAFASPNIGLEFGLAPKWTLDLTAQFNFWDVNRHKWKHWLVQPEFRYWFCERFGGHFLAFHAIGGEFNFGNIKNNIKFLGSDFSLLSHRRYQGWGAGAGVGYGYAWILGDHWNLEAEIAVGWIYTRYDSYPCAVDCGTKIEQNKAHNYVGPTKLSLAIEYLF